MKIVYTARASRQLLDLRIYISDQSSPERAKNYTARIVSFCEKLRHMPLRGTVRSNGFRTIGFEGRATIVFRVEAGTVLIEGIFYGGQNIDAGLWR